MHAFPREGLEYVPVVQTVVVGVGIHVGERQAVQLGVRQAANYRRLEMLLVLKLRNFGG